MRKPTIKIYEIALKTKIIMSDYLAIVAHDSGITYQLKSKMIMISKYKGISKYNSKTAPWRQPVG